MDAETERLRSELSRAVAHRAALQEALAAAEGERDLLAAEGRSLRAEAERLHADLQKADERNANLHGALNVTLAENDRLKEALGNERAALELAAPAPAPEQTEPPRLRALPTAPVIEVRDLCKTYRMPTEAVETLKERVLHPIRSRRATRLEALRDISFDVHRGEFLGIAGANGSGKSTLLKLLANVYAADAGTIRTAGRVAPFIELGVGLNPEFAAFDNVLISGVMMGLEPEEARARYPAIIEFAGLEDFTEVKLKNYSSGMRVRLAFSVMAQVDADILLIDEVLAVGDAEFREKCLARMRELRRRGKTIVLVTHAMETMAKECDRGILLADGVIRAEGDPHEVARTYLDDLRAPVPAAGEDGPAVRLVEA